MIPLTKYGIREMVIGAISALVMGVAGWYIHPYLIIIPIILFIWVLFFFRNPKRTLPEGESKVISPADGVIVKIEEVDETEFINGRALKIDIFLSVFNAHLNRSPLQGTVKYIKYTEGKFENALKASAAQVNENNLIGIECSGFGAMKIMVRQISGAIARRIVCDVNMDQELTRGEIMGMIKFGSRTELYIPIDPEHKFELLVKLKDKVRAGKTIMGVIS